MAIILEITGTQDRIILDEGRNPVDGKIVFYRSTDRVHSGEIAVKRQPGWLELAKTLLLAEFAELDPNVSMLGEE